MLGSMDERSTLRQGLEIPPSSLWCLDGFLYGAGSQSENGNKAGVLDLGLIKSVRSPEATIVILPRYQELLVLKIYSLLPIDGVVLSLLFLLCSYLFPFRKPQVF